MPEYLLVPRVLLFAEVGSAHVCMNALEMALFFCSLGMCSKQTPRSSSTEVCLHCAALLSVSFITLQVDHPVLGSSWDLPGTDTAVETFHSSDSAALGDVGWWFCLLTAIKSDKFIH